MRYTMAVRTNTKALALAIAGIDDDAREDIDYTIDGEARVAECTYNDTRLVARRTRLTTSKTGVWRNDSPRARATTARVTAAMMSLRRLTRSR